MIRPEQAESESAVLLANASFYRAFSEGNASAMSELWARHAPVACIHPGAPMLVGREPVLQSWRQILRADRAVALRCDSATVQLLGVVALVLCYEGGEAQPAHLAASNVFVLEEGAWRMVHHHAGPLSTPIAPAESAKFVN
jgi:hypothetical protein